MTGEDLPVEMPIHEMRIHAVAAAVQGQAAEPFAANARIANFQPQLRTDDLGEDVDDRGQVDQVREERPYAGQVADADLA